MNRRRNSNVRGKQYSSFLLLVPCMFLQSIYFLTNALRDTIHKTRTKTPTCFGTQLPSSGSYNNKMCTSQPANLYLGFCTSFKSPILFDIVLGETNYKICHDHVHFVRFISTSLSNHTFYSHEIWHVCS